MMRTFLLSLCMMFVMVASASAKDVYVQRLGEVDQKQRFDVLLKHGVELSEEDLLEFLQSGFNQNALRRGLPELPYMKSDVVLVAIQELGFKQSNSAVPQLTELMLGKMTPGIRSVINQDTETFPLETADQARERQETFIRFNAMVALGLIGDQSSAASIRQAITQEQGESFAIEGSVALGLLEQKDALDILISHFQEPESDLFDEAFQAVFFITGRNYDVSQHASYERKVEVMDKLQNWWKDNKVEFDPYRTDILRRRQAGLVLSSPPLGTVRGALRATKDFDNYDDRYAGRQYLKGRGKSAAAEYQMIANDPLEDLDIRVAAMEWYAASDPDKARKDMQKISDESKDEIIRNKAVSLIAEIKELKENGK